MVITAPLFYDTNLRMPPAKALPFTGHRGIYSMSRGIYFNRRRLRNSIIVSCASICPGSESLSFFS